MSPSKSEGENSPSNSPSSSPLPWLDSPESHATSEAQNSTSQGSSQDFIIYEDPSDQATPRLHTPWPPPNPDEEKENIDIFPPESSEVELSDSSPSPFSETGFTGGTVRRLGVHFPLHFDLTSRYGDRFSDDFDEELLMEAPPAVSHRRLTLITVDNNDLQQNWGGSSSPDHVNDLSDISQDFERETVNDGHDYHIQEALDDNNDEEHDDGSLNTGDAPIQHPRWSPGCRNTSDPSEAVESIS